MQCLTKALRVSFAAVLAFAGGCARLDQKRLVSIGGDATLSRTLAVDVQNQFGSVTVEVNPEIAFPRVTASCIGETESARTPDFVTAELANEHGRSILRVLSASPGAAQPKSVDLTITVPSCDGLRIINEGGRVNARRVNGAVDIVNDVQGRSGGTMVFMDKPTTAPFTVNARRGGIDVRVPEGSVGLLSARSAKGLVRIDVGETRVTGAKATTTGYSGRLGDGTNEITLVADEGEVQFIYAHR